MPALQPYQELAAALRERLEVIADREFYARDPAAHLGQLQSVSERIAALEAKLPPPIDPQLAHFLQRRSYDKALLFVHDILAPALAAGNSPGV